VKPRHRGARAHLGHLNPSNAGVALDALREPKDAVGDGEDRIAVRFRGVVLAREERRGLPAGQVKCEPLHELLKLHLGTARVRDGPKRVDHDGRRLDLFDLGEHALHDACEVVLHRLGAEVYELDRSPELALVEEAILLHVPEHLDRRLAEHGEVDCWRLRGGSREDDLLRKRGLAGARIAGDEVE
jgi:hypothetical protein